VHLCRIAAMNI